MSKKVPTSIQYDIFPYSSKKTIVVARSKCSHDKRRSQRKLANSRVMTTLISPAGPGSIRTMPTCESGRSK